MKKELFIHVSEGNRGNSVEMSQNINHETLENSKTFMLFNLGFLSLTHAVIFARIKNENGTFSDLKPVQSARREGERIEDFINNAVQKTRKYIAEVSSDARWTNDMGVFVVIRSYVDINTSLHYIWSNVWKTLRAIVEYKREMNRIAEEYCKLDIIATFSLIKKLHDTLFLRIDIYRISDNQWQVNASSMSRTEALRFYSRNLDFDILPVLKELIGRFTDEIRMAETTRIAVTVEHEFYREDTNEFVKVPEIQYKKVEASSNWILFVIDSIISYIRAGADVK